MRRKVLIVDSQPGTATCLEFLMKQAGYDVLVADRGEKALELVSSHHPDLVLMDTVLPDRNGYEVCQTIRENPQWQDIKIVFLSARVGEAEVAKGMDLGADAYVNKPFCTKELVKKVDELLERIQWT
jgi:DNA-binding response OmpR family regulator